MNQHIKSITTGTLAGLIAVGATFLPSVGYSHTRPEARPTACDSAVPYPGWAQTGRMYSRDGGGFFYATQDDEGITHTYYDSSCDITSSSFSPFGSDNDSSDVVYTAADRAALIASGMSPAEADATIKSSQSTEAAKKAKKDKKAKKAKGNCGNKTGGGGNGGGNTCS